MKRFKRFLTAFVSGTVALSVLSGGFSVYSETTDETPVIISSQDGTDLWLNNGFEYDENGDLVEKLPSGNSSETTTEPAVTTAVSDNSVTTTYTTTACSPCTCLPNPNACTCIPNATETTTTTTAAAVVLITTTSTTTTAPPPTTTLISHTTADSSRPAFKVFDIYKAHMKYMFELTSTTATTTTTRATTTTTTTKPAPVVTQSNVERGIKGIDVSGWQGYVDWKNVKSAGVNFAMIRAGYGRVLNQKDSMFDTNMNNTAKVGMNRGVYWYSYATSPAEARIEAETCYQIIKNYKFEYPIFYDMEEGFQQGMSTATTSAIADAFCTYMQEKGYYVGIYSFANFINTKLYQNILDKYDVWAAHYGVASPGVSTEYGMWQYTSHGLVSGINGYVDFDYAYKDYPYIMAKYHKNGY